MAAVFDIESNRRFTAWGGKMSGQYPAWCGEELQAQAGNEGLSSMHSPKLRKYRAKYGQNAPYTVFNTT